MGVSLVVPVVEDGTRDEKTHVSCHLHRGADVERTGPYNLNDGHKGLNVEP